MGFTSARTITASANQPRAVFVDLPLGHTTGLPGDAEGQRRILVEGLRAAEAIIFVNHYMKECTSRNCLDRRRRARSQTGILRR